MERNKTMWTVRRGVYISQWNGFKPEKVIYKAPTYKECLSIIKKYGSWNHDYEIFHVVGTPARTDKQIHVLTGENLRKGRGAFVL